LPSGTQAELRRTKQSSTIHTTPVLAARLRWQRPSKSSHISLMSSMYSLASL